MVAIFGQSLIGLPKACRINGKDIRKQVSNSDSGVSAAANQLSIPPKNPLRRRRLPQAEGIE
jgi:hypothetical protein